MECFGIANISEETYYRFQRQFVVPSINILYSQQEQQVLMAMKDRGKIVPWSIDKFKQSNAFWVTESMAHSIKITLTIPNTIYLQFGVLLASFMGK